MSDLFWWCLVLIGGIFLRCYFHVDPYLPATILFFHKQKYVSGVFYGALWVLILEGYTDLPFGSVILYYMSLIFFYFLLKKFFKSENIFFIIFLSMIFFPIHYVSIITIAKLSDIYINLCLLFSISFKNLLSFPILWLIYSFLYNKYFCEKQMYLV